MKNSVNYLAVTVAALVNVGLGYLWFVILFSVPYVEGLGRTQEQMSKGPNTISSLIIQLLGNCVMGLVLAWLIKKLHYQTPGQGLALGFFVWLGFVAAVIGPLYAFQAFSLSFFLINSGAVLMYLLVSGIILSTWK